MKMLVFDGPRSKAGKEAHGSGFHLYYQDVTVPVENGAGERIGSLEREAQFGDRLPFDQVHEAALLVALGFCTETEDPEPAAPTTKPKKSAEPIGD